MVNGTMLNYPHPGGAWDQDARLLSLIETARRAWYVFGFKPANKLKWTPEDKDFMRWVNNGSK